MRILKIISEHKHIVLRPLNNWRKSQPIKSGYKRVEAIVEEDGQIKTKHIDIENN